MALVIKITCICLNCLRHCLHLQEIHTRKQYLQEAQKKYKEAHDEWAAKVSYKQMQISHIYALMSHTLLDENIHGI